MADAKQETNETGKKKTNPLVFVGIGCLVLLVLIGIGTTVAVKFFAQKIGSGLLEGAIEKQTGVKTNLDGVEEGKMTFTDNKTGAQVNIGSGTVPENFPKDFPLYPGAKVTSSLSGGQSQEGSGFWLTLTTPDTVDKVSAFYKSAFAEGNWDVTATYEANDTTTQAVKKGDLNGTVSFMKEEGGNQTQIVIVLGSEASE